MLFPSILQMILTKMGLCQLARMGNQILSFAYAHYESGAGKMSNWDRKVKVLFYLRIIMRYQISLSAVCIIFQYMFSATGQPFSQNTGGLFGNSQNQPPQTGLFNNTGQNSNPFSNQSQPAPIFGASQQTPNSQGMFGFNQGNTPTGNVFGGSNITQPSNTFGNNSNPLFGNSQNSTQPSMFGNNQNQSGGGMFGNNQGQNQPNAGGSVFNAGASTQFKQNNGLFGGANTGFANNNNAAQGIFGGSNQNSNATNSVFGGGQNAQNSGGIFNGGFGNNNNNNKPLFGGNNSNNAPSVFGSNNANNGNVFGGGASTPFGNAQGPSVFGGSNTNQGGAMFGNSGGGGVFGNSQQGIFPNNQATSSFGNNQNSSQGISVFGNAQNNQGGVFGGQNNNQGMPFANSGQSNNNTLFNPNKGGLFGAPQNPAQSGFSFGTNSGNAGFSNQTAPTFGTNTSNQNSFGNTSWGVPTGNTQAPKFTPLKPKNPKIDGKHMIKCITLLDENMNFCKNQLRIRYIMTGGASASTSRTQPLSFGQPAGTQPALFGANTSPNTGVGFGTGNTFGQNNQPTGGNLFGNNPSGGGNTLFGSSNTGGAMFGGNAPVSQPNTGFSLTGNTANNQGGGFGLFGNSSTNNNNMNTGFKPAGGGLFGASNPTTPAAGGGSLFGNMPASNQSTGGFSFFNNNNNTSQPQSSLGLFGNTSGNTMFGGQGNNQPGGLFGNSTASQPTQQPQSTMFGGSLFGSNPAPQSSGFSLGGSNLNAGGGMFGQASQMQPNSSFMGNQTGMFSSGQQSGNVAQFATSFLNGLFNSDFFKKLISRENNTPFDDLKKEAAAKYSSNDLADAFRKYDQIEQQPLSYIPRYNKYHRSLYGSSINFNQSPYLSTETDYDQLSHRDENNTVSFGNINKSMRQNTAIQSFQYTKDHTPIISRQSKMKTSPPQFKPIAVRVKNYPTSDELPVLDGYQISPTLEELKGKTVQQLKKVPNVVIGNQFGKIKFGNQISLYKKRIGDCVKIVQNSIDIVDEGWEKSKCELFFYNFGGFKNLASAEQKAKMEKKIKRWVDKNERMREKNFNKETGELHVEVF